MLNSIQDHIILDYRASVISLVRAFYASHNSMVHFGDSGFRRIWISTFERISSLDEWLEIWNGQRSCSIWYSGEFHFVVTNAFRGNALSFKIHSFV